MLGKSEIAAMIPHAGTMCLLDGVLEWNPTKIKCVSQSHHDENNPMLIAGQLPAMCGIEYAAQAMAVHGGVCHVRMLTSHGQQHTCSRGIFASAIA